MSTPVPDYLSAMLADAYPFTALATDERFNHAIADLQLTGPGDLTWADTPAVVAFDSTAPDFIIKCDTTTVIDTAAGTVLHDTTVGDWRTIQWMDASQQYFLTVIFSVARLAELAGETYLDTDTHYLVSRAMSFNDKFVRTLTVIDTPATPAATTLITEDPVLISGYNTELKQDPRDPTRLTLSAVAGSGLGQAPADCDNTAYIWSINGIGSDDNGNIVLNTADDCSRWLSFTNGLKLQDDCASCTSCDDIQNLYHRLHTLWTRASALCARILASKAEYSTLVGLLNTFKTTLDYSVFTVSAARTASHAYTFNFIIQTGIRRLKDIEITLTFSQGTDTVAATYVDFSGHLKLPNQAGQLHDFSPGEGSPAYTITQTLERHTYSLLGWTLEFVRPSYPDTFDVTCTVTATEVDDSGSTIGPITFTTGGDPLWRGIVDGIVAGSTTFSVSVDA